MAVKQKDGTRWLWRCVFKQDFVGGKFQKTKLHSVSKKENISGKKAA